MAVSLAHIVLWGTGIVFVGFPHLNLGLLSDYKICGDPECESLISRAQATRDHHGKDCRYLSFNRGNTIFVYHKLTGRREDLWAGSIDKQFGYFPKDAVREEHVLATMEKVVKTQESDFICMDEFGYLIDSSHLDSDGDDDNQIQNQESETIQTTQFADDTNALTADEDSMQTLVSELGAGGTATEEDKSKNAGDVAAGSPEEEQEAPASLKEQGGSTSSPWLGSSVTGWLGLATVEEPAKLAEEEKNDESKETKAEASFTSSMTDWLGFGGQGKPDNAVKGKEEDRETTDSGTSSVAGWLDFGGEKKTDHSAEKEQVEGKEVEPAEMFRSRRMSLDLEGSQLHDEEKREMGTLDWLGNGLSNTLGFGLTNQESGHEREAEKTVQVEQDQPESSSWFNMGMENILGFGKDKTHVDESTESGIKETDETLEQTTEQQQAALTEETRTGESKVEEAQKYQNVPSEIEKVTTPDNNDSDISVGTSDSHEYNVVPEESAFEVDEKEISPPKLAEKPQAVSGMSTVLKSFFQTGSEAAEEDNVLDDNETETNAQDGDRSEREDRDHQITKSIENECENDNRKPDRQMKSDEGFWTQSDIKSAPDSGSVGLNSNSTGQSVAEEGKTEDELEERDEIKTDDTRKSSDVSVNIGAPDDPESEGGNTESDESADQSQVTGGWLESIGESQPFSSSGNDPVSARSEETKVFDADSLALSDTEAETRELGQEEEGQASSQEFGSSSRSTDIMSEDASEEYENKDSVPHPTLPSDGDAHTSVEAEEDGGNSLPPVQSETMRFGLDSVTGEENQEEIEELKGEEVKAPENQGVEELHEEQRRQEVKEVREEEKEEKERVNKEEKQEEKDLKNEMEEEKEDGQEELLDLKEELQEAEEIKEKEQKVDEDKQAQSSHPQNSLHSSPHDQGDTDSNEGGENNLESVLSEMTTRQTRDTEEPQKEEEKREEENKKQEERVEEGMKERDTDENVEGEEMEKAEKEGNLKCSRELCPEADGDGDDWAKNSRETETGKENPVVDSDQVSAERIGLNERASSEGMEEDDADEKKKTSEVNTTGNEDVKSDNALRDDLLYPAESKDGDQLYSSNLSDGNMLHQQGKTEPEDTETNNETTKTESDIRPEGGIEMSVSSSEPVESQPVVSEQAAPHVSQHPSGSSLHSDGDNEGTAGAGSAFGLFKNPLSFFSQTPVAESETPSLDPNPDETSHVQTSPTPELESATNVQNLHPDPSIALTQQQLQPSPPPFVQTPSPSLTPNTGSPLQTKPLSKHYKSLLAYMSADETTVLMELLGRHKLQFLDYILGSTGTMTDDPENDKSILSDIERFLDYHRETLMVPSMTLPDDEKTRTLIVLQKLEMLLARVRETFNIKGNKQADASCVGESCSSHGKVKQNAPEEESSEDECSERLDSNAPRDVWTEVDKERDGRLVGGTGKERNGERGENESINEERRVSTDSRPHVGQGTSQPVEGLMKQILDFGHRITEDSSSHAHAAIELLIWLTVQQDDVKSKFECLEWLKSKRMKILDQPTCSAILSPIEKVWGHYEVQNMTMETSDC